VVTRQISDRELHQTEVRIRGLQDQWRKAGSLTEREMDQLLCATMRELYPCPCTLEQSRICLSDHALVRDSTKGQSTQKNNRTRKRTSLVDKSA